MPDASNIKSALELADRLLKLPALAASAEAKMIVADMKFELATIKSTLADVIDENRQLKADLSRRSEMPKVEVGEDRLYRTLDGDGPFCPACHDKDEKLIRLHTTEREGQTCPICKNTFCSEKPRSLPFGIVNRR